MVLRLWYSLPLADAYDVLRTKVMEENKPLIIPTRFKAKISHELSFPIGAEKISVALASVPQLAQLVLHFKSDYKQQTRSVPYPCMRIAYSRRVMAVNPVSADGVPLFNEWQVEVSPVPRISRHRIQQEVVSVALPRIVRWLHEREHLSQQGSDLLTFFYDAERDIFSAEMTTHLEPLR